MEYAEILSTSHPSNISDASRRALAGGTVLWPAVFLLALGCSSLKIEPDLAVIPQPNRQATEIPVSVGLVRSNQQRSWLIPPEGAMTDLTLAEKERTRRLRKSYEAGWRASTLGSGPEAITAQFKKFLDQSGLFREVIFPSPSSNSTTPTLDVAYHIEAGFSTREWPKAIPLYLTAGFARLVMPIEEDYRFFGKVDVLRRGRLIKSYSAESVVKLWRKGVRVLDMRFTADRARTLARMQDVGFAQLWCKLIEQMEVDRLFLERELAQPISSTSTTGSFAVEKERCSN